jgi:glutamyl-tRNA synthetase
MTEMRVRFAPSPTGYLHVGNARIALANWLLARRHGGHFTLRFDDTDSERSRPEYETAIMQDLRWLGLEWDDSFHQSGRRAKYDAAADRLRADGRLYPCFESEEELRVKREMKLKRGMAPIYDRAMLKLTAEQRATAEAGGRQPYWRFRLSDRSVGWTDQVLGSRQVKLTAVSDPVVIRADGTPLYSFTSVVDDLETRVTHIIRGEDHVTNTGVQLDIMAALGADGTKISFGHLPLLTDSDGSKLSKRLDSMTLRSLARDGIEPMAINSYLARLGSADDPTPLDLPELAASFDLGRISHSSARFDVTQLLALNARVLHGLSFEAVRSRLPPAAAPAFWNAIRGNLDMLSEARGWWEVVVGDIVPPVIEGEHDFLVTALELLPSEPWDDHTWKSWTEALKEATGRKGRALYHPLRLALTGDDRGPELAALLPLMGYPRSAARLRLAAG